MRNGKFVNGLSVKDLKRHLERGRGKREIGLDQAELQRARLRLQGMCVWKTEGKELGEVTKVEDITSIEVS